MSKAEKTKAFIIEKTAPIFNKKGYAGTSLNDMTEATGLTKGSIYGNFTNKDEVAVAVFRHNLKKMQERFDGAMSQKETAKDKLLAYADYYEQFSMELFPSGGCPIMNTAIEADDTHPILKEAACRAIIFWKENLEKIVLSGIQNKEFKKETNPQDAALAILATIEGAVMISKLTGNGGYLKSMMGSLRKLIDTL